MAGSPTATRQLLVVFADIIQALLDGKSARRQGWPDGDRIFMRGGFLHIRIADSTGDRVAGEHQLLLSEGDLAADDWVIL